MNDKYIALLQRRIAMTSIGPSTARGMGPKGTITAARQFLVELDLRSLQRCSPASFESFLNRTTDELVAALPRKAQYWGSARKFLNIFLRGLLYNRYLCDRYNLYALEPWLEIPLDRQVAKGLHGEPGSETLPKWRTVISLSPAENKIFQEFAKEVAISEHTYRVHLDLLYWRRSDDAQGEQ
jgi:hypothetical protein